jgi:hypothetical protein
VLVHGRAPAKLAASVGTHLDSRRATHLRSNARRGALSPSNEPGLAMRRYQEGQERLSKVPTSWNVAEVTGQMRAPGEL